MGLGLAVPWRVMTPHGRAPVRARRSLATGKIRMRAVLLGLGTGMGVYGRRVRCSEWLARLDSPRRFASARLIGYEL